jgi:hypothetical protein
MPGAGYGDAALIVCAGRSQIQNRPKREKPGAKAGLIANNF